jgi:hypothetical protein
VVDTGGASRLQGPGDCQLGRCELHLCDRFPQQRRIDVYDATFQKVTLPGGGFTDPNLPAGYAPFGIQAAAAASTSRTRSAPLPARRK